MFIVQSRVFFGVILFFISLLVLSFQNCGKVQFERWQDKVNSQSCNLQEVTTLSINQTNFDSLNADVQVTLPENLRTEEYSISVDFNTHDNQSEPEILKRSASSFQDGIIQNSYTGVNGQRSEFRLYVLIEKNNTDCTNSYEFNIVIDLSPQVSCSTLLSGPNQATVGVQTQNFILQNSNCANASQQLSWDYNYDGVTVGADGFERVTLDNFTSNYTYSRAGTYNVIVRSLFNGSSTSYDSNAIQIQVSCASPISIQNNDNQCVCHSTGEVTENGTCEPCGSNNSPNVQSLITLDPVLGCQCPAGSTYNNSQRKCICSSTGQEPTGSPLSCQQECNLVTHELINGVCTPRCPAGQFRDGNGQCVSCGANEVVNSAGNGCVCASGFKGTPGACTPISCTGLPNSGVQACPAPDNSGLTGNLDITYSYTANCQSGESLNKKCEYTCASTHEYLNGSCVIRCSANQFRNAQGICTSCPSGSTSNGTSCVCSNANATYNAAANRCDLASCGSASNQTFTTAPVGTQLCPSGQTLSQVLNPSLRPASQTQATWQCQMGVDTQACTGMWCGTNQFRDGNGQCVTCPAGQSPTSNGCACFLPSTTQDGTAAKPWIINSCECLQAIETNPGPTQKNHHFRLGQNLNCSATNTWSAGLGFTPIQNFTGVLDGAGFEINSLTVRRQKSNFMTLNGATIRNLNFSNVTLDSSAFTNQVFQGQYVVSGLFDYSNLGRSSNVTLSAITIRGGTITGPVAASLFSYGNFLGTIESARVTSVVLNSSFPRDVSNQNYHTSSTAGGLVLGLYKMNGLKGRVLNSRFSGEMNNFNFIGGIAHSNVGGEVIGSEVQITVNSTPIRIFYTQENISGSNFHFGGIVGMNFGGLIQSSTASGSVNVKVPAQTQRNSVLSGGIATYIDSVKLQDETLPIIGRIENTTSTVEFNYENLSTLEAEGSSRIGGFGASCYVGDATLQPNPANKPKIINSRSSGNIRYRNFRNDNNNSIFSNFISARNSTELNRYCDIDSNSRGTGTITSY